MPTSSRSLSFYGAAGTVTGSKHLVRLENEQVLLDCGLFQGLKELRLRNWQSPPFDASAVDAVVLSHCHIDHSGYLPLLVRHGFRGAIHCTPATADLLGVVLRDAGRLQEEDAARANRHGYSRHRPALPLYTLDDVEHALALLQSQPHGRPFAPTPSTEATFRHAGHILGSATIDLRLGGPGCARLVFSGDLGRWDRPILHDPESVTEADILLIESTYGDRLHRTDHEEALVKIVSDAVRRRGVVVIPAFAVGRTQELLWTLRKLEESGRLPHLPVYLDSPMAISVTAIYCDHPEEHDLDMEELVDADRCPLCSHDYHASRTTEESKAIARRRGPMIVIAGSGMATGGRVLHHLARWLPDPDTTVLLTGFQAAGTRGRALQDGAPTLRIHGRDVPVRATVATVDGLSAHADRDELLRWLEGFVRPPSHTYVVHGESASASALATAVAALGWSVSVAEDGSTVPLPQ